MDVLEPIPFKLVREGVFGGGYINATIMPDRNVLFRRSGQYFTLNPDTGEVTPGAASSRGNVFTHFRDGTLLDTVNISGNLHIYEFSPANDSSVTAKYTFTLDVSEIQGSSAQVNKAFYDSQTQKFLWGSSGDFGGIGQTFGMWHFDPESDEFSGAFISRQHTFTSWAPSNLPTWDSHWRRASVATGGWVLLGSAIAHRDVDSDFPLPWETAIPLPWGGVAVRDESKGRIAHYRGENVSWEWPPVPDLTHQAMASWFELMDAHVIWSQDYTRFCAYSPFNSGDTPYTIFDIEVGPTEIPPLRQRQRNDSFNAPRQGGGSPPTSYQESIRQGGAVYL